VLGQGRLEDLDLLMEVAGSMGIIPGTTICGLSDGAAWPVKNAISKFRGDFEEYINSKRATVTSAQTADGSALEKSGTNSQMARRVLRLLVPDFKAIERFEIEISGIVMATVTVNGKEVEIGASERLNCIQAAAKVGVEIPAYCWHPALSVVASCRMCLVEVGDKKARRHRCNAAEAGARMSDTGKRRHSHHLRQPEGQRRSQGDSGISTAESSA
jgi:hypothetical protein